MTESAKPSDYDLFGADSDSDDEQPAVSTSTPTTTTSAAVSAAKSSTIGGDGLDDSSDEEFGGNSAPKKKRKLKKLGGSKKKASSSEDTTGGATKKKKKKKKPAVTTAANKDASTKQSVPVVLSKKDRMELLQRKRQKRAAALTEGIEIPKKGDAKKSAADGDAAAATNKGYDSGDSYNSGGEGGLQRTKEDEDFLDIEGEDEDLVKEYFQDQKFHDERGEDDRRRHKDDEESDGYEEEEKVPDNPILAAVHRMKKLKRAEMSRDEREELSKEFVDRMRAVADDDAVAVSERRPAMKKLAMLSEVQSMLAKKDMQRPLLDYDLLVAAKAWIAPLPNGKLGNVTVRQRLLESISHMTGTHDGEEGVTPADLKRSAFGKVIMSLYMHKSETPQMKRFHKSLIEQWSRPIFNKTGNMKDLERVQSERREAGVVLSYQQRNAAMSKPVNDDRASAGDAGAVEDINSIFKKGFKTKGAIDLGNNRVRIPYSKGFQFSVRPEHKSQETTKIKKAGRESLSKRLDVKKKGGKSAKYGNLSVEGRAAKNA